MIYKSERQDLAARVATRMIQADEYARHKAWAQCAAFLYEALKAAIDLLGTYEDHEPVPGPTEAIVRMYAPDGYEGTLMCLEEAVERAGWSGCRVIGVYREPVLADIDVADLTSCVIDWIGDELRYDDALSWDEGGPLLGVDADSPVEVAASNALHDAIKALLEASLDLSEAAWQHERDIWLPEWPGGCDRLWGVRCDAAPALPGWDPRSLPCAQDRHGNPVRPKPSCDVPT